MKILENVIQIRKDIEHGSRKEISGKEIDKLLADSEKYMKRLQRLFTQIEKVKEEESMIQTYDTVQTVLRDVLKIEGVEKATEAELIKVFEEALITTGKIPAKFQRTLQGLVKAKKDYDSGKLSKTEVDKTRKESNELIRFLIDYMHRARAHDLERSKLRVKHGEKYGEITILGKTAYIVRDMDSEAREMEKAPVNEDGSLGNTGPCKPEDFEQAMAKMVPVKLTLKEPLFQSLIRFFGKDYEVLI